MNVLAASQHVGVRRVIYLSSVGVIGADGTAREVDERTPTQPRNAYERSKLAAETECLRHNQLNFAVTALRPPIVYGEGKKSGKDSFLSLLRFLRARRLALLGRQYMSSYAYVGDVAAACQTLADHPLAGGRAFIVSEPVPLTSFLNEAAAILGVREPWVVPGWAGRPLACALRQTGRFGSLYNETHYIGDALGKLGFQIPFGYREGLRRTLTWYRQAGLL
jgi:UDP-glucose 4-epimerase